MEEGGWGWRDWGIKKRKNSRMQTTLWLVIVGGQVGDGGGINGDGEK